MAKTKSELIAKTIRKVESAMTQVKKIQAEDLSDDLSYIIGHLDKAADRLNSFNSEHHTGRKITQTEMFDNE